MAVALPSYLGQRAKAQDSATQQELMIAYKAARLATLDPSSSTSEAPSTPEVGYGEGASSVSTRVASDIKMSEPQLGEVVVGPCATTISTSGSLIAVEPLTTSLSLTLYKKSGSGTVWRLDAPLSGQQTITKAICAPVASAENAAPTISGTTQDSQTLSSTDGKWVATPPLSYSYQWQRCGAAGDNCSNISGATSADRVLVSADVGKTLRSVVTASNSAGSTDQTLFTHCLR
jgi:hypothetical protein